MPTEPQVHHADPDATRKKLLVVVLLAGLLLAILTQPDGDRGATQAIVSPLIESKSKSVEPGSEGSAPVLDRTLLERHSQTRELSRMNVETVDTAAVFASDPPAPPTDRDRALGIAPREVEPAASVRAVYGSSTDRAALVGDEVIRSGESLRDGRRVLRVTEQGLQISP